jgi:hypothetical protein
MWPGAIVDGVASGVIGDIGDKSERPSIDTVLRILELRLIDKWGNVSTIKHGGQLDRIKHQKVLAVLKRRALRFRRGEGVAEHWRSSQRRRILLMIREASPRTV